MIIKTTFILSMLFCIIIKSQRKNNFLDSDKTPNCDLIKKGTFSRHNKSNSRLKVIFNDNKMTEIYGKNAVTIESDIKMLSKCKFEAEIKNIKTKYKMTDSLFYVGKKTEYKIVETGKNSIIYEYWCNQGRNICTEILEKK
jgi:hypothetical protein